MPKFIIYTAIFGKIGDQLHPPGFQFGDEVRCIAYVDPHRVGPGRHQGWELRPPAWRENSPRLQARRHKLLSHHLFPGTEYVLWLDGCLTPQTHPQQLVDRYLSEHDICTFRHMQRSCVYQELEACLRLKKDNPQTMRTQVDRYRVEGYPYHNGLAETTAVLRRQTDRVRRFNDLWWASVSSESLRDQLSFDYLFWRLQSDGVPLYYTTFEGTRCDCPHFTWRRHR